MDKLFIVVASLFVMAHAISDEFMEEFIEQLQEVAGKCTEETNAEDEDLSDLINHHIPKSHEGKCLLFCIYKAFKLQRDDGSIDRLGALKSLEPLRKDDPEIYRKMVRLFVSCGRNAKIDSDPCISAANMGECAIENASKMGLTTDMLQF